MILVVGGLASGKRAYVSSLGYGPGECSGVLSDALPVLLDAEELVRDEQVDPVALAERLAAGKQVVTCCEVGSGIVPVEPGERAWRERVGALSKELAARATVVVRMVSGIPQALKGVLPEKRDFQLVIMRHGTTPYNLERRYTGTTDVGLTEQGERHAVENATKTFREKSVRVRVR